jgi:hypothetical protein
MENYEKGVFMSIRGLDCRSAGSPITFHYLASGLYPQGRLSNFLFSEQSSNFSWFFEMGNLEVNNTLYQRNVWQNSISMGHHQSIVQLHTPKSRLHMPCYPVMKVREHRERPKFYLKYYTKLKGTTLCIIIKIVWSSCSLCLRAHVQFPCVNICTHHCVEPITV